MQGDDKQTALPGAPLMGFNPDHARRVTAKALEDIRQANAERMMEDAEKQLQDPITGIEKAASDVASAEAQQASNILAARIADVRAEVQADTARLIAGPYKRIS